MCKASGLEGMLYSCPRPPQELTEKPQPFSYGQVAMTCHVHLVYTSYSTCRLEDRSWRQCGGFSVRVLVLRMRPETLDSFLGLRMLDARGRLQTTWAGGHCTAHASRGWRTW